MQIHCSYDEMVDPKSIVESDNNPNIHSPAQLNKIAKLIEFYGWRHSIIIRKETGKCVVGHGRNRAALKKKWDQVPVSYQSFASDEEAYGFMVADNAASQGAELDLAMINLEIPNLGPDFAIENLGIDGFVIEPADKYGDKDADDVPEVKATTIRLGDLFVLGNHRLMCGDSTSEANIQILMNGEKADMAFLDPPYNTGMTAKKNGGSTWLTHMFNDKFTEKEWDALLDGFLPLLDGALKSDSVAYICLDWRRSHELVPRIKKLFKFSNLIIWDKMVHGLGSDYKYTHEFLHVCKKGSPKMNTHLGDQEYQDIWHIQRTMGKDEEHATKKPIALIDRAISHASKMGELVIDLFLGSGSTLISAEKCGRRCFGIELEPIYCQTSIDRWEKFTGQKAVKLES